MTAYTFPSETAAGKRRKPDPTRIGPQPQTPPGAQGNGLRVRFAKVPGVTPGGIVDRPVWVMAALAPFSRQISGTWTDYTTVSAGDFSFPQGGGKGADQLDTFPAFSALHLWWDAPWLVQHGQDPDATLKTLERIVARRKPVEMLVTLASGQNVWTWGRWAVSVRQLTQELREGEPDSLYLTVQVSGWRDAQQRRRSANPRTPATRILQAGDTLHSLSQHYYGTATLWRTIRDANGISRRFGAKTPIAGHTRFKVGGKLTIPAKPHSARTPVKGTLGSVLR